MGLDDLIRPENVLFLKGRDKQAVLDELVRAASENDEVRDPDGLRRAIFEREAEYTTGIGLGIAVPHAKNNAVTGRIVLLGRSSTPIDFQALDNQPVSIFVLIAVPADMHKEYIRTLARIATFLKQEPVREAILAAPDTTAIYRLLGEG